MIEIKTQKTAIKEREVHKDCLIAELSKKTYVTNKLLQELINVLKQSRYTEQNSKYVNANTSADLETYVKTIGAEVSSYQSPTLLI
jgi:hypothetical protein